MKPTFTSEQFFEVFKNYNLTVFPMQIIFYLMALWIFYLMIKPNSKSNKILTILLSFFWLWMGIVYHIIFFTTINKLAYVFGGFFIIQGILFLIFGVIQNRFSFSFQKDKYGIIGIFFIAFSLLIYPILGLVFGHNYPYSPTFGLPCPTTIFTFGVLLLNQKKCSISILLIPFVWSIIGLMAVFQFGIFEDIALIVAALITTSLLVYRNKKITKIQNNK